MTENTPKNKIINDSIFLFIAFLLFKINFPLQRYKKVAGYKFTSRKLLKTIHLD